MPHEAYLKAKRQTIFVSDSIRKEWLEVMDRFASQVDPGRAAKIKTLFVGVLAVAITAVIERRLRICRDPADDEYLCLALAAPADVLVTGDTDLLSLDERTLAAAGLTDLRILNPRDFLDRA